MTDILQFPESYEAFPQTFQISDPTAQTIDGKVCIPAGTIWPANDASAKGVVLNRVDLSHGPAAGAVLFEAAVNTNKIPSMPSDEAKAALPRITWFGNVI